jgi:two-component system, cell cycle response regulator CpdR
VTKNLNEAKTPNHQTYNNFMANIILAEDDNSLRPFLAGALEKAGHKVTSCPDGVLALGYLEDQSMTFDLLLTDIVMPGLDGLELARHAARLRPAMKVMFITGFSAMASGHAKIEDKPLRVVSKPFHLSQLVAQVNDFLLS